MKEEKSLDPLNIEEALADGATPSELRAAFDKALRKAIMDTKKNKSKTTTTATATAATKETKEGDKSTVRESLLKVRRENAVIAILMYLETLGVMDKEDWNDEDVKAICKKIEAEEGRLKAEMVFDRRMLNIAKQLHEESRKRYEEAEKDEDEDEDEIDEFFKDFMRWL